MNGHLWDEPQKGRCWPGTLSMSAPKAWTGASVRQGQQMGV